MRWGGRWVGFQDGDTCTLMADLCQCMAKPLQYYKIISLQLKLKKKKKKETHFKPKHMYRLKVRGWKNIFHANGKQKKAGVSILKSDKIGLKIKNITRDKEGHYIMIKGINPRGRHSNCKYLCIQHRST